MRTKDKLQALRGIMNGKVTAEQLLTNEDFGVKFIFLEKNHGLTTGHETSTQNLEKKFSKIIYMILDPECEPLEHENSSNKTK